MVAWGNRPYHRGANSETGPWSVFIFLTGELGFAVCWHEKENKYRQNHLIA
jgi:hypothetical protein